MRLLTTLNFYPNQNPRLRMFALWYFTVLLTIWTIAGHTVLGFEQSDAQPVAGVAAALLAAMLFEWVDAKANHRPVRFARRPMDFVNFLPPCIIPGLACAMLIYPNERLGPVVFASVLSIASKLLFRAPIGNGQTQHIFNPSNFGISATLLLMPSVGLAPPYQFTENITGVGHWVIPGIVLLSGIFIHAKFTGRLPLVMAWIGAFVLQGTIRSLIFGFPIVVPFVPMTSAAFALFSLYMIPDPATTPLRKSRQILFGASVAAIYGALLALHVVYGLFFALAITSAVRGAALWGATVLRSRPAAKPEKIEAPRAISVGAS